MRQRRVLICVTDPSFRYLNLTASSNGKSFVNTLNKLGQGRKVIRQLNSPLWSSSISGRNKKIKYHTS